jgi:hypothetical protein
MVGMCPRSISIQGNGSTPFYLPERLNAVPSKTYARSRQQCGPALVPGLKSGVAYDARPIWRLKLKPYLLNVRVERDPSTRVLSRKTAFQASSSAVETR